MKKIISLVLVLAMVIAMTAALASCSEDSKFKIGVICLHDETSTYDRNFIEAIERAKKSMGLSDDQVIIVKDIPEDNKCYEAAKDLVEQGCKVIFADSFGHEDFMIKAAKEFPDVHFAHATGTKAHTEKLPNYHNAFASIYEGRYLAGVAAGLKLKEIVEQKNVAPEDVKIGYVGAFPYAEVVSGYTAYYLGVKSIVENVKMEVQYTGSWYDVTSEKNAALTLIDRGCLLISQHADSMGAPSACEEKGIPNVSYNGSTVSECPETFIVSSKINWTPYFELLIKAVRDNKGTIPTDWTGTISTGSVELTAVNDKAAAAGTQAKIDAVKADLLAGKLHVFDLSKFTVGGSALSADFKADVDTDKNFTPDTVVIKDGYFDESAKRSAPYFEVRIDGITELNKQ